MAAFSDISQFIQCYLLRPPNLLRGKLKYVNLSSCYLRDNLRNSINNSRNDYQIFGISNLQVNIFPFLTLFLYKFFFCSIHHFSSVSSSIFLHFVFQKSFNENIAQLHPKTMIQVLSPSHYPTDSCVSQSPCRRMHCPVVIQIFVNLQVPSEKIMRAAKVLRTAILTQAPHMIRDRKYHLKTYK